MKAKDGVLTELIAMAVPLCRQAEKSLVRKGPGRKPIIPDWFIASMIIVSVAKGKKSKSAQFRFWQEHWRLLESWRGDWRFPARSTFFDRYRRAWRLFELAITLQTEKAIRYGWTDAKVVSVDKSVVAARGDKPKSRSQKRRRRVDPEATWGYSEYHGWTYGYSYEVVLTSTKSAVNWPIMASVDVASRSETKTLGEKIPQLPAEVDYLLADRGYDADDHCEAFEWNGDRRTGKRFVCPTRRSSRGKAKRQHKRSQARKRRQAHRQKRKDFVASKRGKKLYARRSVTIEPFNSWFKLLFDLSDRTWHRGLDNNRTQILAAIFVYQLLLRINWKRGKKNGQIKWILDSL